VRFAFSDPVRLTPAGEGWKLIGHFNAPEGNLGSPFSVDVGTSYVTFSPDPPRVAARTFPEHPN